MLIKIVRVDFRLHNAHKLPKIRQAHCLLLRVTRLFRYPIFYLFNPQRIFRFVKTQCRGFTCHVFVTRIVKERQVFVVFFVPKRIIRMTVTLNTAKRCSLKYIPSSIDAVYNGSDSKFFILGSAFVICHRIAVKTGRHQIIVSGIGQ